MYTNGSGKIIQYWADNIFLSVAKVCKICEKSKKSSSQEWRFGIQTHHRDRKVTTSSATGNFLAHNFGFSGEFRVCTNDPEPMKRNLLAEIENLSCQDCQICRKTVITRLEAGNEPGRFSLWGDRKITIGTASAADDVVLRRWRVTSGRIRTVLKRLFCIWRCEFFFVLQSSQNLRKSEKVVENRASPIFQFSKIERSRFWRHP